AAVLVAVDLFPAAVGVDAERVADADRVEPPQPRGEQPAAADGRQAHPEELASVHDPRPLSEGPRPAVRGLRLTRSSGRARWRRAFDRRGPAPRRPTTLRPPNSADPGPAAAPPPARPRAGAAARRSTCRPSSRRRR